jgi:hypothetical protein
LDGWKTGELVDWKTGIVAWLVNRQIDETVDLWIAAMGEAIQHSSSLPAFHTFPNSSGSMTLACN